jgi:hypothetical protein
MTFVHTAPARSLSAYPAPARCLVRHNSSPVSRPNTVRLKICRVVELFDATGEDA